MCFVVSSVSGLEGVKLVSQNHYITTPTLFFVFVYLKCCLSLRSEGDAMIPSHLSHFPLFSHCLFSLLSTCYFHLFSCYSPSFPSCMREEWYPAEPLSLSLSLISLLMLISIYSLFFLSLYCFTLPVYLPSLLFLPPSFSSFPSFHLYFLSHVFFLLEFCLLSLYVVLVMLCVFVLFFSFFMWMCMCVCMLLSIPSVISLAITSSV